MFGTWLAGAPEAVRVVRGEQTYTGTHHRFAGAEGFVGDADARLDNDGLRVVEQMVPLEKGDIVGGVYAALIAGSGEGRVGQDEAVLDAARVIIHFEAHTVGNLDVRANGPFIRHIEIGRGHAEVQRGVKREGLAEAGAIALAGVVENAVGEVAKVADAVGAEEGSGGDAGVRDLIVAGVDARFEGVLSAWSRTNRR